MKALKSFGEALLGVAIMGAIILILAFFFVGGLALATIINPILIGLVTFATVLDVIIFLPLGFFKKTRKFSVYGLYISSYLFGASLWIFCFLVTYTLWGLLGLVIGVFMGGIGVLPIAALASLIGGHWSILGNILYATVLTYGSRILALYWAQKVDEQLILELENSEMNNSGRVYMCMNCGQKNTEGGDCPKCGKHMILFDSNG